MISQFLGKLKSILFKSTVVAPETPLNKEKKSTKSAKATKTKTRAANQQIAKNV